ncbi:MAG: hypothetical protein ACP5SD_09440 [Elusimicrobiales bacterium]
MKYETFEDLYSYEALNIAKNILKDGESVTITKNKNKNIIDISSENPDKIFKELMNEALNQQCRIDISKKNFKVSQMIITKALVSALGEEPKSKKRVENEKIHSTCGYYYSAYNRRNNKHKNF